MEIWVVTSVDYLDKNIPEHRVVGAYLDRGQALDACAQYILERIHIRYDFANSFVHDLNHEEVRQFISGNESARYEVRPEMKDKFMKSIREELEETGCYYISDSDTVWHIDVDVCDVVGEL